MELRITGGWVRDKLLGGQSNDLDIAVNVLSGQAFALELLSWAEKSQVDLGRHLSSLHTIKANPEKSKHLETCTTKLYDLDIDFVNLRNEKYSEDSRVPIIQCGTAEEDALRRDATLNALFYNINSGQIEDLTGRGLEDLKHGILRTPLAPVQTFLDDPLRILRLVRFACRFNFTIDEDTLQAMADDRMREALVYKISRERVGVEISKILIGPNIAYGLRLLNRIRLTDCIFGAAEFSQLINEASLRGELDQLEICRDLVNVRVDEATQLYGRFLSILENYEGLAQVAARVLENKEECKLFWLSTILRPYGALEIHMALKKSKPTNYALAIIKQGLRFGRNDYETVPKLIAPTSQDDIFHKWQSDPCKPSRSQLGLYIRRFGIHFETSVLVELFNDYIENSEVVPSEKLHPQEGGGQAKAIEVMQHYQSLLEYIKDQGLLDVAEMKPLVDGMVILKALQRKPGPWMRDAVQEVVRWQLDHPDKGVDECVEYIRGYCQGQT